jgi:hypothetical protein
MFFYLHILDLYLLENFNDEVRNKLFQYVSVNTILHRAKETYLKTGISAESKGTFNVMLYNTLNIRRGIYLKCKELCVGDVLSAHGSKLFILNLYIHEELMPETINRNNIDEDLLIGKRPLVSSDIKYSPKLRDAINIHAISNIKAMNEKWNLLFKNSEIELGKY